MSDLENIRRRAGWSRDRVAVEAGVAYATCRIYELHPAAVIDPERRARLDAVYAKLRAMVRGGFAQ
jgi:hypothetical protein